MTVFLGTLWCSIKKIEAPYLSDSELWIALHPMQGNQASSPGEGYVSWDFSSCGRNLGYILELQRDGHSKLHFVHRSQDSCLVMMDTSGIQTRLEPVIQILLELKWETKRPFLVSRKIFGFLSIFKKSQASSPLKH